MSLTWLLVFFFTKLQISMKFCKRYIWLRFKSGRKQLLRGMALKSMPLEIGKIPGRYLWRSLFLFKVRCRVNFNEEWSSKVVLNLFLSIQFMITENMKGSYLHEHISVAASINMTLHNVIIFCNMWYYFLLASLLILMSGFCWWLKRKECLLYFYSIRTFNYSNCENNETWFSRKQWKQCPFRGPLWPVPTEWAFSIFRVRYFLFRAKKDSRTKPREALSK